MVAHGRDSVQELAQGLALNVAPITPRQLRAVWGYAGLFHLSEQDLRAWVFSKTGKRSLRRLSRLEASRLIGEMIRKEEISAVFLPVRSRLTPGQRRFILELERSLGWDDRRLLGLARRMYHIGRLAELSPKKAAGLIEALKAIRQREAAA